MCGLFGVIGSGVIQQDLTALRTLGFVSELRGRHGTGIAQGNIFGDRLEVEIDKSNMDFAKHLDYNKETNFETPNKRKILGSTRDNFFLCHVRHATVGGTLPSNAHPYLFDNIVGMHNGTLVTSKFLPYTNETVTDSYKLFEAMDKDGADKTLSSLTTLDAMALVYIDRKNPSINIIRNRHRTLFWAVSRNRSCLWYASEAAFLKLIDERHRLNLTEPVAFEENSLYSFKPSDVIRGEEPKWGTEPRLFTIGRSEPTKYDWGMESNLYSHWSDWETIDQRTSRENFQRLSERQSVGRKIERGGNNVVTLDRHSGLPRSQNNEMPWSNYEENNGYSSEAETRAILNGFKPRIQKLQGVILCTSVREIPVRECVVCGKVMSLYDVFLGSEFGEFEGLHQDCTEQYSPKTIVV